jgi:hypothetical protein
MVMAALVLALTPGYAGAQQEEFENGGPIHVGPIGLTPKIGWQTAYEDNVFRSPTSPISDLVSTFSAQSDIRGRMRRVGLTGSGSADWVHYASLESERGANVGTGIKLELLFNRVKPYVSASYNNSRQRLNPEVDVRPRVERATLAMGGVFRVGGKTSFDFSARRARIAYDKTATDGVILRDALDSASDHLALSLLQEVTPLTRIAMTAEMRREEFDHAAIRGADQIRFLAGFESTGRIRGHARAGVRLHKPQDPALVESRGFLVSVGTNATFKDRLQIGIDADRDLAPSYRPDIAYYESYGLAGSLNYAIRRSVRLLVTAGRRIADYRSGSGTTVALTHAGVEHQTRFGTGVSYLFGKSMSLDLLGRYETRTSPDASRRFDGMGVSAGVSHAF